VPHKTGAAFVHLSIFGGIIVDSFIEILYNTVDFRPPPASSGLLFALLSRKEAISMNESSSPAPAPVSPLWTRDFTIITLGSVISMLGNSMSGFALSLLVLDYTGSNLLYAIYIATFTLPQIVMPIFSGAILDRFSRKKTIYTLDFLSSGVYLVAALILSRGWFSFLMLALFCFIIGSINSIYYVAYDSFYPLLISEGNYSKAYSIASVLETLSALIIPIATYFYNLFGIAPLLGINALCFFIAATAETQIRAEEHYIEKQRAALALEEQHSSGRQLLRDIKEGFRYLMSEKGLLRVAIYFTFSMLASGASQVITLPYFKSTFDNGEYIYMLVWGMAIFGRAIGGGIHYKIKLPVQHKYSIALMVYVVISLCEGFYLYCPLPVMMASCFLTGILGVTSYTIRISATQSYVPDEKKGRFNGAFNMLNTVGSFTGNLLAGALVAFLPVRGVLTGFMLVTAAAAGGAVAPGFRILERGEGGFGGGGPIPGSARSVTSSAGIRCSTLCLVPASRLKKIMRSDSWLTALTGSRRSILQTPICRQNHCSIILTLSQWLKKS